MSEDSLSFQETLIVFFANDKIQALKQNFQCWLTCNCHHETDSFPVVCPLTVTKRYRVLCQHDTLNSLNQYFPTARGLMSQNHAQVKKKKKKTHKTDQPSRNYHLWSFGVVSKR
jgi:hypothetical protein